MLVAMLIHGAESILIQVYVRYAYLLEALERGQVSPLQPNLFSDIRKGLLGFGLSYPLTTIGVFIVKLNFLFFIRRLSTNIRTYTVFWWIVLVFNVGVTGTLIGLQDFSCFFGSTEYIFGPSCTNTSALRRVQIHSIISSALDALSEVLSKFAVSAKACFGEMRHNGAQARERSHDDLLQISFYTSR